MLVFGGSSGPVLSDAWSLSLAPNQTWRPFSTTRRKGHTAVLDPSRHRMLIFGGESSTQLNDAWELTLDDPARWTRLYPEGTPPPARALHGAIYDTKRDRMIVFGGRGTTPTNDVWELSFFGEVAWRPISAVGTAPPARLDPCVVYDPLRRRMIVFGGADASGVFNDVWTLSLSGTPTWTKLLPSGSIPSGRGGSQAIYDPLRDRLVIHGGYDRNFNALADVWALSFVSATPTWSQVVPSGTMPLPRFAAATVYDPTRDRMLITSGTDFTDFFAETWALNFSGGAPAWSLLSLPGVSPTPRSDHKAVYDEMRDRLVFFGGLNPLGVLHDAWELDFTTIVDAAPIAEAPRAAITLAPVAPNPSAGAAAIAFTLASPGAVRVTLHDALGRRVRLLSASMFAAGPQRLAWDGRDDGGSLVKSGLYFVRVESNGEAASGKLIRTR
jgi:hypothetical protein